MKNGREKNKKQKKKGAAEKRTNWVLDPNVGNVVAVAPRVAQHHNYPTQLLFRKTGD